MEQEDLYFITVGAIAVLVMTAAAAITSLQAVSVLALIDAAAIAVGIASIYYLAIAGKHYGGDIIRPIMVFCVGAPLFVMAFHMPSLMALVRQGSLVSALPSGFWAGLALTAMLSGFVLIAYGFNVFYSIGQER